MDEPHNAFVNDLRRNLARRRLKIAAIVAVLVIFGAAAGIGAAAILFKPADTFAVATSKVGYKVYVPQALPADMKVNNDAAVREGAVIFSVSTSAGPVVFTEQPVPKDIKIEDFYSLRIKGAKELEDLPFQTVAGTNLAGDATMVSVLTDTTWILITGPFSLQSADVKTLVQQLQTR